MGYYDSLSKMINESKLTLKEIAQRCESYYGVKINPSYISKLQTKKQAPASDEVNEAIAKVCNGDVESFCYEGFLEKAPNYMKAHIYDSSSIIRSLLLSILESLITNENLQRVEDNLNQLSDIDLIKKTKEYLRELPKFKADFYRIKEELTDEKNKYLIEPFLGIEMNDDSMEPRIPKGSSLDLIDENKISNGDVCVIKLEDESYLIRRVIDFQDKVMLLSDNLKYEPLILEQGSFKLIGKVKFMTKEI